MKKNKNEEIEDTREHYNEDQELYEKWKTLAIKRLEDINRLKKVFCGILVKGYYSGILPQVARCQSCNKR